MAGLLAALTGLAAGARLALTTFTVAPLKPARVDRASAGIAMLLAPLVGAALGALIAAAGLALRAAGAAALLIAAVSVGLGVLLTRGLHLDGLADTADGLGCYGNADRTLAVMRQPDVGPFGVAAIVMALLLQIAGATTVFQRGWPAALAGVVAATAAGRFAATVACRRGIPAARPDGLGALVAGTVGPVGVLGGAVAVAALAIAAVPARPWQGPLAVLLAIGATLVLTRHVVGRIGGVTGDVLGAVIEVGTCLAYVGLAAAP